MRCVLCTDECDVAFGISNDCNGNGIPDECDATDPMMDCDANGVPDTCELGNPVTEFNSGIRMLVAALRCFFRSEMPLEGSLNTAERACPLF